MTTSRRLSGCRRIAESDVHTRHLLVLEQDADHLAQAEVRAEGELADAIAVRVGMTVGPEVFLKIAPVAVDRHQPTAANLEHHGVTSSVPYFALK